MPHALALTMSHILLTFAYEESAPINAMSVWALSIICIDVDVDDKSTVKFEPRNGINRMAMRVFRFVESQLTGTSV